MQGRERAIDILSVRSPQPQTPTCGKKEEKEKRVVDEKLDSSIGQ